jgi:hypothetical protein
MQLVFGRDAILNVKHVSNWEHIRQRKQARINENNKHENRNRRDHAHFVGDKTLVKARKKSKHELECEGPHVITQSNDNGTARFQKGIVDDAVNTRRIKPFHEQTIPNAESSVPDHRGECSRPEHRIIRP